MSLTYVGILAYAIMWLARISGIEITDAATQQMAGNIITLIAILTALFGRWRAGGIKWFGARKEAF